MVKLGEVNPMIWDTTVEIMEKKLKDLDFQEEDILFDWKRSANRRKFNRELFEKYGVFKDIILHPKFQLTKQWIEDNCELKVILGDPLIPTSVAIIILFMINKRVSYYVMALLALFLFNVNPLYVSLAIILWWLTKTSKKPKLYKRLNKMQKVVKDTMDTLNETINTRSIQSSSSTHSSDISCLLSIHYDHVLIGNDLSVMYCAALLSRIGHSCCVIQPTDGPNTTIFPDGSPCSVPLHSATVGKIERYQYLLDLVQSHESDQRVTFSPLGTENDSHTSTVMRVIPNESNKLKAIKSQLTNKSSNPIEIRNQFYSLRVGEESFAQDLADNFLFEKRVLVQHFQSIKAVMANLSSYLFSKIVPPTVNNLNNLVKSEPMKSFTEFAGLSVDEVLVKSGLPSQEVLDILAAIATTHAKSELSPSELSAYYLADGLGCIEGGIFTAIGGYEAIERSLMHTIHRSGGTLLKGIEVDGLILEEDEASSTWKAMGVSVRLQETIPSFPNEKEVQFLGRNAVVSGMGVLTTYLKLLPVRAIHDNIRGVLSKLTEARPKVQVIFWFQSNHDHPIGFPSTEYIQTMPANLEINSNSQRNEDSNMSDQEMKDMIASNYVRIWSPSSQNPDWKRRKPQGVEVVIVEMFVTKPSVQLKEFKLPLSNANLVGEPKGPKIYTSTHPNDSHGQPESNEFASRLGYPLSVQKSVANQWIETARSKLSYAYPQTISGQCIYSYVSLPQLGGHSIFDSKEKFTCSLSAHSGVENLYLTGCDLSTTGLAGEIQSGWVTVNAILGYNLADINSGRNLVSDLQNIPKL